MVVIGLHNTVNVSRATESDANGSHDKYIGVMYINHNKTHTTIWAITLKCQWINNDCQAE